MEAEEGDKAKKKACSTRKNVLPAADSDVGQELALFQDHYAAHAHSERSHLAVLEKVRIHQQWQAGLTGKIMTFQVENQVFLHFRALSSLSLPS